MTYDDTLVIERRAANLSLLLAATDVPARAIAFPAQRVAAAQVRRARASALRWRIAAAIAVLGFGLSLVPPVRAWIAERARLLLDTFAPPAESPGASAPVFTPVSPGNRVTFAPSADVFTLDVTARQAAGTLTVVTADGEDAAYLSDKPGDAAIVVLPGGLRIVTTRTADASYTVRVPASLKRVQVRVGGEPPVSFLPERAGQRFVVQLGRNGPSPSLQP